MYLDNLLYKACTKKCNSFRPVLVINNWLTKVILSKRLLPPNFFSFLIQISYSCLPAACDSQVLSAVVMTSERWLLLVTLFVLSVPVTVLQTHVKLPCPNSAPVWGENQRVIEIGWNARGNIYGKLYLNLCDLFDKLIVFLLGREVSHLSVYV